MLNMENNQYISEEFLAALGQQRIIPVATLNTVEEAARAVEVLQGQDINIIEVTFRVKNAAAIIKYLSENTDMYVGAGTVVNVSQARLALESGAKFLVLPGFLREVVEFAVEHRVPVFPGCVTPSEIMRALSYGLEVLKFFPSTNFGGITTLKAFAGPFGNVKFIPTGGINPQNKDDYLALKNVFAVAGTWVLQ
jgi:2-dehydro-3-deoxyphosphogluconate aldolase/(4S)-4-hydroxy-2-oxoglutarate aldolase